MTMPHALRKLVLIVHLTVSVGWIGAVAAYLTLGIGATISPSADTLRSAWMSMGMIGQFVIVPCSLMSLFTGLILSLGTKWGLFRHYWVLISLVLTSFATIILLQHMPTVSFFASIAAQKNGANVSELRNGLQGEFLHAGVGELVLFVIQILNVYKPRGLTVYGWRKLREQPSAAQTSLS